MNSFIWWNISGSLLTVTPSNNFLSRSSLWLDKQILNGVLFYESLKMRDAPF